MIRTGLSTEPSLRETLSKISGRKVYAVSTVDHRALQEAPNYLRHRVKEDVMHLISSTIATEHIVETEKAFHTEFRAEFYVLTVDEVQALIEYGRRTTLERAAPPPALVNKPT